MCLNLVNSFECTFPNLNRAWASIFTNTSKESLTIMKIRYLTQNFFCVTIYVIVLIPCSSNSSIITNYKCISLSWNVTNSSKNDTFCINLEFLYSFLFIFIKSKVIMIGVSILTTACKPSIIFFPVNTTDFIVVAQQSQHTFKCIKVVYVNLTVSITCRNHMTTIAKLEFFASFY